MFKLGACQPGAVDVTAKACLTNAIAEIFLLNTLLYQSVLQLCKTRGCREYPPSSLFSCLEGCGKSFKLSCVAQLIFIAFAY